MNWLRYTTVTFSNMEFSSDELDIHFDIQFSVKSDGNVGHIRVYNLSDSTISRLKKGVPIILKSGYQNDYGAILPGTIFETITKQNGKDQATDIVVSDHPKWLSAKISKTWSASTTTKKLVSDIAHMIGLKVGEINPTKNLTYSRSKSVFCTANQILQELALDSDSKLHVARGLLYFRSPKQGSQTGILLTPDTGLLSISKQPLGKDNEQRYKVLSVLKYQLYTDSLFEVKSSKISGIFRVVDGKHISDDENHNTEVEVVKVG